jgi:transcriptional regulator with XRE-family HTH domain
MEKQELINYTNELFKLFITDLMKSKQISRYRIAKDTGLTEQFFSNKFNGYGNRHVSLPTVYKISNQYNFTFDLLKYDKQYKQQLKLQSK